MINACVKALILILIVMILSSCEETADFLFTKSGTLVNDDFRYTENVDDKIVMLFAREYKDTKSSTISHQTQIRLKKIEYYFSSVNFNELLEDQNEVEFFKVGELNGDLNLKFAETIAVFKKNKIYIVGWPGSEHDLCGYYSGKCTATKVDSKRIDQIFDDFYSHNEQVAYKDRFFEIDITIAGDYSKILAVKTDKNEVHNVGYKTSKSKKDLELVILIGKPG